MPPDERHPWLPHLPTRTVRCYRCAETFDVALKAMSASCPHCYKRIDVSDIIIRHAHWGGRIETCGSILVQRRAKAQASTAIAGGTVDILGVFEGSLIAGGAVRLGPEAVIRGAVRAPNIHIDPGAVIDDAHLDIPGNALDALTRSREAVG
ncbi:MAG: polymer-forming cytoskeletal protein [Phycisphaerales bacterium JB059]